MNDQPWGSSAEIRAQKLAVFSRVLAIGLIVFISILHCESAVNLSLWGDEFDAIAPAKRPWKGDRNFWWQILQYIANPPGENLVLRGLYKAKWFQPLLNFSPEVFWRLPYIMVYAATGLSIYLYSEKWSRSSVVAILALVAFVSAPGPFYWATEVRFYTWAIFFMAMITWQVVIFIEAPFSMRRYFGIAVTTALGVCFHVSIALVAYLLLFYSGFRILQRLRERRSARETLVSDDYKYLALLAVIGLLPFRVYKYAKHNWMYVPFGKRSFETVVQAFNSFFLEFPAQIGSLLPRIIDWSTYGIYSLFVLIASSLIWSIYRKNYSRALILGFFLIIIFGGCFLVIFSAASAKFSLLTRHFLFAVPVSIIALIYLLLGQLRTRILRVPVVLQFFAVVGVGLFGFVQVLGFHKQIRTNGSPAKVNLDFSGFKKIYRNLPDRKQLVFFGDVVGPLAVSDDAGGYLGGAHVHYLSEFSPLFLSSRDTRDWAVLSEGEYDFLILTAAGKEPNVKGFEWNQMACVPLSWNLLRFCRRPSQYE